MASGYLIAPNPPNSAEASVLAEDEILACLRALAWDATAKFGVLGVWTFDHPGALDSNVVLGCSSSHGRRWPAGLILTRAVPKGERE